MKINIFGGLLVAALAITSVAQAQTQAPKHARHEHKIENRIAKGLRSGKLTPAEAIHFRKEDKRIREEKRMAIADGKMTPAEHKMIHRQKKMLSRAIRREEHSNEHNDKVRG